MNGEALLTRYEPTLQRILSKYVKDPGLREDCAQEARVAILACAGKGGRNPDAYIRRAIQFTILGEITNARRGDWYGARTRWKDGVKEHLPPRFIRLDELLGEAIQIDTEGNLYGDLHKIWGAYYLREMVG